PAQEQPGIAVVHRNWNLVPGGIGLAPVGGGPAGIEIVQGAVTGFQPLLKLRAGLRIEGGFGILIVNLPAEDIGIVAKALGHLLRDFARHFAILWIRPVKLLAIAMLIAAAVFPD